MKLNFNQMENLAESDLVWFFCHSEADCGIKSNWNAMVSASCFGSGTYYDHTNNFILDSVSRLREIDKIYKNLNENTQRVLFATFADIKFNDKVLKTFQKYTGSAHASIKDIKDLVSMCQRQIEGKQTKKDKSLLSILRIEAIRNYQNAISSYAETKYKIKKGEK